MEPHLVARTSYGLSVLAERPRNVQGVGTLICRRVMRGKSFVLARVLS